MVSCFICNQTFSTIQIFIKHFEYKHFSHNFSIYYCAERDCNRSFNLLNSFKKHLSSHIKHLTIKSTSNNEIIHSPSSSTSNLLCVDSNNIVAVNSLHASNPELELPILPINKFVSSLYSNSQNPRNIVQEVMDRLMKL
jgi:hypothetical protein